MQRAFAKRRTFTDGRAGDSNPNGLQPEENELPKETTISSFYAFNQQSRQQSLSVPQKIPISQKSSGEYKILIDKYFTLKNELELILQKLHSVGVDPEKNIY